MADHQQVQQWEILLATGRTEAARADIGAQLARQPEDPAALRYLSRVLLGLSEPALAERAARDSLAGEPDNEWGLRLLSVALGNQGNDAEAVIVAQRAIDVEPLAPQVWVAAADRLIAAKSASKPGLIAGLRRAIKAFRPLAAVGLAKHAVSLDPDEAGSMLALSRAYTAMGDRQRAVAVLGLVLRNEPDNEQAQQSLAALDSHGGRWVALAMTAELVADDDSRVALRSRSIQDFAELAGQLPMDELRPLQLDERGWVDDRGVTNAMAEGGDADVGRWVGLQIRAGLCLAGLVQLFTAMFGGENRVVAAVVVAEVGLTAAGLAYPRRPGRSPAWRAFARRQLRSASTVLMVLLNLAGTAGAACTLFELAPTGLKTAAVFGICNALVLLVTMMRRDAAAYRILMPSGNTLIAAFRSARASATVCLLAGFGASVLTLVGQDGSKAAPTSVRLAAAAAAVAAVGLAGVYVRRRDAAVRRATRLMARGKMRWVSGWSVVTLVTGLFVVVTNTAAVAIVTIGSFVLFFELTFLWIVGEVKYLPGMKTTTVTTARGRRSR